MFARFKDVFAKNFGNHATSRYSTADGIFFKSTHPGPWGFAVICDSGQHHPETESGNRTKFSVACFTREAYARHPSRADNMVIEHHSDSARCEKADYAGCGRALQ